MSESLVLSISTPDHVTERVSLPESASADGVDPREYYFFKPAYTVEEAVKATGLSRTTTKI
jgi:hypothetical protein